MWKKNCERNTSITKGFIIEKGRLHFIIEKRKLSQLEMSQLHLTSQTQNNRKKKKRNMRGTSWEAGNCLLISLLQSRVVQLI